MSTTTHDLTGSDSGAAQHELLSFAVANSPVIFYVADAHDDHAVRFISANVASITGHAPDAFVGNPSFGRSLLHPDDLPAFDQALQTVNNSGYATREYRMRAAQGEYQWFHDELKLAEGGREFVGSMIDVTGEKNVQDRLREAEELNTAIVGTVGNAIVAADVRGRILDFNAAAEGMFGYTRDQVMGRSLADLIIPEQHRAAHSAGIRRFAETGEMRMVGR